MSRLPQPSSSSSRPGVRTRLQSTPSTPVIRAPITPLAKPRAKTPVAAPSPTLRTQPSLKSLKPRSPTKSPAKKPQPLPADEDVPPSPKPQLSLREQIALKRAEAKKVIAKASPIQIGFEGLEDASPHTYNEPAVHDVDLGRWSVKETIERARSSGAVNLSSRNLPCIPSALFEIHLGITPEPLKSVPVEPPITTSTSGAASSRKQEAPSWYDAQDLEILKAWSNEILEIQPEISMFGSLKTIDLHNNKLTSLPDSFADLMSLAHLDLSHNQFISLPTNFWALPHLTTLNLSHNFLTALPFSAPFGSGSNPLDRTKDSRGDWFSQTITRATEPLPRLISLDVSHNNLSAAAIDHRIPTLISKLHVSENPLGKSDVLLCVLGRLGRLKELHMLRADIGDDSFPVSIFSSASGTLFPSLKILDLEETHVSRPVVEAVFVPNAIKQTVQFDFTNQEPPDGVLRIVVGKRVVKEAWEIEAERRLKLRRGNAAVTNGSGSGPSEPKGEVLKEPWEVDQGLLTDGAKRLARAQAAAAATSQSRSASPAVSSTPARSTPPSPQKSKAASKAVEKEAWEIDAEQGLFSAGARRRARAAAAAAAVSVKSDSPQPSAPSSAPRTPSPSAPAPATIATALTNPQYYDKLSATLTLPPSAAPTKALHARSFSVTPAWHKSSASASAVSELELAIPTRTLPLAAIAAQPFAHNLKVLILAKRRADPAFGLPLPSVLALGPALPYLEELSLENCALGDTVSVFSPSPSPSASASAADSSAASERRASEPILPLLARLFPSVRTLDLSYNALTSACLPPLARLLFADPLPQLGAEDDEGAAPSVRKGVRHLRLRGNRLDDLGPVSQIAERFRGNREVPEWRLEELDLRDNEIGRLPAELGLLPLDVLLVDGNVFRVPPRRVWEREGTKGLLSWLRGRIE